MKTLTMRSMFAVAALAVAAVSASAQTYKADVPVAFHVGKKVLAPGTYQFHVTNPNASPTITIRNVATKNSAIAVAAPGKDAPKAWREEGKAVIGFECLGSTCALKQIWNGQNVSVYSFPGLKVGSADAERLAYVTVSLTKGD